MADAFADSIAMVVDGHPRIADLELRLAQIATLASARELTASRPA